MLKIIGGSIGTFLVLVILVLAGFTSYEYYQRLPKVLIEFEGLKLGDTLSDACFKLGPPLPLANPSTEDPKRCSPNSKEIEMRMFKDASVHATFKNDRIISIYYACNQSDIDHTSLNGINCGDKGEDIADKFQENLKVFCHVISKEKGPWTAYQEMSRVYDIAKYGTRFYLSTNTIHGLEISSPHSNISEDYEPCH